MTESIDDIELAKIEESLKELKSAGLIDYEFEGLKKERVKVEVNKRANLDMLLQMGDIPFPVKVLETIKEEMKKNKEIKFDKFMHFMLATYYTAYEQNGRSIEELSKSHHEACLEIEPSEILLSFTADYDLENPVIDFQYPQFYWYSVKKEIIQKLREEAEKQDLEKLESYLEKTIINYSRSSGSDDDDFESNKKKGKRKHD